MGLKMSEVVRIFNDDGQAKDYELLASRLPKFLEKYGPEKGYRIIIESTDFVSSQPGLLRLYEAAISGGIKPKDIGLPSIGHGFVFTAKLIKGDEVVLTASSLQTVLELKDWEIGETAARQRLVAAAGFDGTSIRKDEEADMAAQKLETDTNPELKPVAATRRGSRGGKGKKDTKPASAPDEKAPKPVSKPNPEKASGVPPAMLRQIEHLAKLKGKKVETPTSMEKAKNALKELLSP